MPVVFEILDDNQGVFLHQLAQLDLAEKKLNELIEQYEHHHGKGYDLKKLRKLIEDHPEYIDGYVHLAHTFLSQDKPKKALEIFLSGLSIANRCIPEGFSGTISWGCLDNRPFLRALYGASLSYVMLRQHKNAIALIEKLLHYNPNDNQGIRLLLGSEYLRNGQKEPAEKLLKTEAAYYPPYYYELALLHIHENNWVSAATALRQGFYSNPYIAEILCGNYEVRKMAIWHSSNFNAPEAAHGYLSLYADLWFKSEENIAFLHWLYNHPRILAKRAIVSGCLEELYWELLPGKRKKTLDKLTQIEKSIDDCLSRELVKKRKTRYGQDIYPWESFLTK